MKIRLNRKNREEIGKRIREVRLAQGLEQTALAERLGVSQAIVSQYEGGQTEASLSLITYLRRSYGVSADWILSGEGPVEEATAINLGGKRANLVKELTKNADSLPRLEGQIRGLIRTLTGCATRKGRRSGRAA